jgi:hypothetical protein
VSEPDFHAKVVAALTALGNPRHGEAIRLDRRVNVPRTYTSRRSYNARQYLPEFPYGIHRRFIEI